MDHVLHEALRYMGAAHGADAALEERTRAVLQKLRSGIRPGSVWRRFEIRRSPNGYLLCGSGLELAGDTARRFLDGCGAACVFACTIGAAFDRMLEQAQRTDMAEAVILDACGSALVEELCDRTETEIRSRCDGMSLKRRFSPGYGDLPLSLQPGLLGILDAVRRIGVTCTESDLMLPVKTVTAIAGLADGGETSGHGSNCEACAMKNCEYRIRPGRDDAPLGRDADAVPE